ncbi:hypothetical protein [Deinococcus aquaticus]|uniref:Apea-like HEPN domain-containing protein n=1 Tax=Deinococcus aquaticus TaxID=328692 RepID=A0ABY7V710_9DEIO|nr:hypothetical protein [Deinococcus aquaticus]WDA59963.1 hypothetical protein M8445_07110 [Deinococcus aquaticus]
MSKSVKDINSEIFARLSKELESIGFSISPGTRWISSERSANNLISGLRVLDLLYSYSETKRFYKLTYNDRYFIFLTDFNHKTSSDSLYIPKDTDPLTVAAIYLTRPHLSFDIDTQQLENDIGGISKESYSQYQGHDIEVLLKYFIPMGIFEISDEYSSDIDYVFDYIAHNRSALRINHSEDFLLASVGLTNLVCSKKIPMNPIISAILTDRWDNAFLYLYRIIESLYYLPDYIKLSNNKLISCDFKTFDAGIDKIISWRPRERDSLASLFEDLPPRLLYLLKSVKGQGASNLKIFNPAPLIYSIRNDLVHDHKFDTQSYTVETWQKLTEFLIGSIVHIYQKYDRYLPDFE